MRTWVPVLLVLASLAVAAASPHDHQPVQESTCYECHAEGLWDPAMEVPQVTESWFTGSPTGALLHLRVSNPWLHTVTQTHAMVTPPAGMELDVVRVDHNGSIPGTFPLEPMAPQTDEHTWVAASGAQEAVFTLRSGAEPPHDLSLHLIHDETHYGADVEDDGTATLTLAPEDLAASRSWTVQVTRSDAPQERLRGEAPYQVDITQRMGHVADAYWMHIDTEIAPGQDVVLTVPVSGPEVDLIGSVRVQLAAQVHYDHADPTDPDEANILMEPAQIGVQSVNGTWYVTSSDALQEEMPGLPGIAGGIVVAALAMFRRRGSRPTPIPL